MIFEDKLVALLKNPGYTVSQGYRLYEVDPFGLMYFPNRCLDGEDPAISPGDCSTDSKRSLDNYSYFNIGKTPQGLFNFQNTSTEQIVDVFIDQATDCVIFIQSSTTGNYTRIYVSPYQQIERRTLTEEEIPNYFLIGQINSFVATRSVRHNNTIYAIDATLGAQIVYKIDLSIVADFNYASSSISASVLAIHSATPIIKDIAYDRTRDKLVGLRGDEILIYDGSWNGTTIPNNTGYVREHQSITHDYINDLYIIGNLSGVGSAYDFRGPFRDILNPDNILNDAAIFTIVKASDLNTAYDVPYVTIDNIEQYRYPLIFPIDNPSQTPTLPYKTYCNISKIRFFDMNGVPRLIGRDDFIYQVINDYLTGEAYAESSFIHRSLVSYSSYAASNGEIIDGVLSVVATTDSTNAVSTDPNTIPQWISFDYGEYVDPDCSRVLINNIKICHERSARCVGSDNLIVNGDFLEGLENWTDLNGDTFPDPFDPSLWTENNNTVTLGTVSGIKQSIEAAGLIDLRIKINAIEPAIDPAASLIFKFYEGAEVVYEEEITLGDINELPYQYSSDFAVEADAFSIELGTRATSAIIDFVLLCDIQGEKACKPGYAKIAYDSFIDNNGEWVLASDPENLCGQEPEPPQLEGFDVWYNDNALFEPGLRYFGYDDLIPKLYSQQGFYGYTIDKINKRVFWIDNQYRLHKSSQINPNDDLIIANLQSNWNLPANTSPNRLIAYDSGIFFYCSEIDLRTGKRQLILINDDGFELRRTILPNARIDAITAGNGSVLVSTYDASPIGTPIFSIYKYNIQSLALEDVHIATDFDNAVPASIFNLSIDRRNNLLYYHVAFTIEGGGASIRRVALDSLTNRATRINLTRGGSAFVALTIHHFDVDASGDLIIWWSNRIIDPDDPFRFFTTSIISRAVIANGQVIDLIGPDVNGLTVTPNQRNPSLYTNSV